jgi:hypothetical protein
LRCTVLILTPGKPDEADMRFSQTRKILVLDFWKKARYVSLGAKRSVGSAAPAQVPSTQCGKIAIQGIIRRKK